MTRLRPPAPIAGSCARATAAPVRDLALVGFLAALLALGFKRPFLFVLAYAYVDIVSPQRLSYYLLNSIPLSMVVAGLAFAGSLTADDKRHFKVTGRQWLMFTLLDRKSGVMGQRVAVLVALGDRSNTHNKRRRHPTYNT